MDVAAFTTQMVIDPTYHVDLVKRIRNKYVIIALVHSQESFDLKIDISNT